MKRVPMSSTGLTRGSHLRASLVVILSLAFSSALHAQNGDFFSLDALIGADYAQTLRGGGEITRSDASPCAVPQVAAVVAALDAMNRETDANFSAEGLRYYKKTAAHGAWSAEERRVTFRAIMELSAMMPLHAAKADKAGNFPVLYTGSRMVDAKGKPLSSQSDPTPSANLAALSRLVQFDDADFGKKIFDMRWEAARTENGCAYFTITQKCRSRYFPAIKSGALSALLALFDTGDAVLLYAVSVAKIDSFAGIVRPSVIARGEAMLAWLQKQIGAAEREAR